MPRASARGDTVLTSCTSIQKRVSGKKRWHCPRHNGKEKKENAVFQNPLLRSHGHLEPKFCRAPSRRRKKRRMVGAVPGLHLRPSEGSVDFERSSSAARANRSPQVSICVVERNSTKSSVWNKRDNSSAEVNQEITPSGHPVRKQQSSRTSNLVIMNETVSLTVERIRCSISLFPQVSARSERVKSTPRPPSGRGASRRGAELAELREGAAVRAGPGAGLRLPHRPSWFHRVLWCRREVRGATKR